PYELIKGRKPNVQYFYVFDSLCYPTNDHDDLGKMKPKADIGIFVGYSKSSRGFRIYNRRTRKIMETIHVKFDELTAMASECNNSRPEYYEKRTQKVSDNSSVHTLNNEDTPSSSSIIIEDHDAPYKDVIELDGNTFMNPFVTHEFEEAESSSNYQDPSNMHEFHQQHRFTDRWTKNHQIEQVIGDPSKPVTKRSRLHTDAKMCMYALTVSLTEPTNIKEVMLDHIWINSMQEELNQFKRLYVWELVERPADRNVIKVKWL
ncbi:gag-pol polyprotein, partial [Tanacetum coccineum]